MNTLTQISTDGSASADTATADIATGPIPSQDVEALKNVILKTFEDAKAENTVVIDLIGKSSVADAMIVTSGRSDRHVSAISEQLQSALKNCGKGRVRVEGQQAADWVLLDTGDIIVHIFRPEVRDFYNLEKMWTTKVPEDRLAAS